jgi:hypothetical protein
MACSLPKASLRSKLGKAEIAMEVLWLIVSVLFILWLVGLALVPGATVLVHFLLLAAFLLATLRVVRGERIL